MTPPPSSESATRGCLIPIGGAEDKDGDATILRRFVSLCGGRAARLAVIPTASRLRDTGQRYVELFRRFGARDVTALRFRSRHDCQEGALLDALRGSSGVFLTGGNQTRLADVLGGTPVQESLLTMHRSRGVHVAGTSAGAAVMSSRMIAHGRSGDVPYPDMVALDRGLGFTETLIIDQHFSQRDRLGRLLCAMAYNPRKLGLGLDEDTSVFIGPDDVLEVVGSGTVTIVDPAQMRCPGRDELPLDSPLALIGVRLHILTPGMAFDLTTRDVVAGPAARTPPEADAEGEDP